MGKVAFGHFAGLIFLLIQFSLVAAITTVIDDSDAQIGFTGPWTIIADHVLNGANTNYYNGATHTTTSRGASASFTFTGELFCRFRHCHSFRRFLVVKLFLTLILIF